MSGYILCQGRMAQVPYYLKHIQTNIYSVEELCYYLYHNLYLIDETVMNEELCYWLSTQLGLATLSARIHVHLGKRNLEDFIYPIYKEIGYLTYEELKDLSAQIKGLQAMSSLQREKCKADSFLNNNRVAKGIQLYQKLLSSPDLDKEEGLEGVLHHNLACAYAGLFQMEKAREEFQKAYVYSGREEELILALLTLENPLTSPETEQILKEAKDKNAIRTEVGARLRAFSEHSAPTPRHDQADELLDSLMHQYHRAMSE